MDNLKTAGLNGSIELIFLEALAHDIEPIVRLTAYLCLKYHVQASMKPGWTGDIRPNGFFDLLRNIFITTDEDDGNGILTLELRVFIPQSTQFPHSGLFPIPEVVFERIGSEWFVENAEIHIQTQWRLLGEVEYNRDIDSNDPFLQAFREIGFNCEARDGQIDLTPDGNVISVDSAVETFLANKPGARRSSLAEFSE